MGVNAVGQPRGIALGFGSEAGFLDRAADGFAINAGIFSSSEISWAVTSMSFRFAGEH
jgi:hypothetical protein